MHTLETAAVTRMANVYRCKDNRAKQEETRYVERVGKEDGCNYKRSMGRVGEDGLGKKKRR